MTKTGEDGNSNGTRRTRSNPRGREKDEGIRSRGPVPRVIKGLLPYPSALGHGTLTRVPIFVEVP